MNQELETLAIAWQELREAIGTMLCALPNSMSEAAETVAEKRKACDEAVSRVLYRGAKS